jgi:hypothetical protein
MCQRGRPLGSTADEITRVVVAMPMGSQLQREREREREREGVLARMYIRINLNETYRLQNICKLAEIPGVALD